MRIRPTDDERELLDATRGFLGRTWPIERARAVSRGEADDERTRWRKACELGWASAFAPEELGGGSIGGRPFRETGLIAEELGAALATAPIAAAAVAQLALRTAPDRFGDELGAVLAGESVPALCRARSRSGAGDRAFDDRASDAAALAFRAVLGGGDADRLLVAVPGERALVAWVAADEVERADAASVDALRRFASVRVPVAVLEEGRIAEGPAADALVRDLEAAWTALVLADALGAANALFAATREWAASRSTFGRTLDSYQALKHRFADMHVQLEACNATVEAALDALDAGAEDRATTVRMAAYYVGTAAPEIAQECIQLHGGIGVTWEHDAHLFLRRIVVDRSLAGAPDAHARRIAAGLGLEAA